MAMEGGVEEDLLIDLLDSAPDKVHSDVSAEGTHSPISVKIPKRQLSMRQSEKPFQSMGPIKLREQLKLLQKDKPKKLQRIDSVVTSQAYNSSQLS